MEYRYKDSGPTDAHSYLWPAVAKIVADRQWSDRRAFDLGCGNGATCQMISELGFEVTGVDPSKSGIAQAKSSFPHVHACVGSAYDDLAAVYGPFPLVISLEVIEHCIDPRSFAKTFYNLIAPGGLGILTTPYHGYLKNLALAVTGRLDRHFTVLWDGGHIKFFSIKILGQLLSEVGAGSIEFECVGRIPTFAKSMIAIIRKI